MRAGPGRASGDAVENRPVPVDPPPGRRWAWVAVGALVVALTSLWSLAVPLMASPDEPSHVIRAAAVARGQWSGELGPAPTDRTRPGAATTVLLPSDFAAAAALPNCFAFHPDTSAACQQSIAPAHGTSPAATFAGQYPPLYYLLVGWPSRFLGAEASVYAMRLLSALLTGILLTWGAARTVRDVGPLELWGVLVAVSPMVLFLGATVNPEGLEIAAGFSFFAAALSLATSARGPSTGALAQAAVSGAVLVNIRTSSPLWAVVVVVVVLIAAPRGRLGALVRHPGARWVAAVAGLAAVAAVGWVATHGAVVSSHGLYPEYANPLRTAFTVLRRSSTYLTNMVGNFGWLDSPAPPATLLAWSISGGALVLLALTAWQQRRERRGLVLLILVVALAPVALQVPTAADAGLIWQGRYALPIAVGVPLVAARLLNHDAGALRARWYRALLLLIPVLLVGQVDAFLSAAHRYAEGDAGTLLTLHPAWSSPIGYLPGVAAYALLSTVLAALAWRSVRGAARAEAAGTDGTPGGVVPLP